MTPVQDKPVVGLLILDLDNTVWEWFDAWHKSFTALLDELTKVTEIPVEQLKSEIRDVHQARGTTEYSWLLDELPSLAPLLAGKKASEVFDSVLHAQNSARKRETHLYPGVKSTLEHIRSHGVRIVAYTESLAYWTEWRMRQTELDGVIDFLYSSPDHDFPEGTTVDSVRTLPDEDYGLRYTVHRHVARGIAKPDPQVLKEIIDEHAVAGLAVVYVGDNLDKDIEMAQRVGVLDVHAEYGEAHRRPEYELIRDLTHWTTEAVEKESSQDARVKARPSYVLKDGLFELLGLFQFGTSVDVPAHLKLWEKSVDVQMHFNDLGWRIRALALTALTFTFAATGVAYANTDSIDILGYATSPAAFVPVLGLVLWFAFSFMDVHWFHRLLRGSVRDGERLESLLQANGISADLGGHIGRESPMKFRWQKTEMHSTKKLQGFYRVTGASLLVTALAIFFLGAPDLRPSTPTPVVNNFEIGVPAVPSSVTPEPVP